MSGPALRLAFAGTPDFAAVILERLLDSREHTISTVLTRPDRPAGRGRKTTAPPVRLLADRAGISVRQPASARAIDPDGELAQVDALIVAAFGMILPAEILNRPRLGCINVHASLLPRWRGPAPIQRAIEAGDSVTGISIMHMDAGVDTGPVLLQHSCPIRSDDTGGSLHDRLALLGGDCLLMALRELAGGSCSPRPQNDLHATHAPRLSKPSSLIDWTRRAASIERQVRAFNPVPGAHTELRGLQLRVLSAHALYTTQPGPVPGTVVAAGTNGIDVAAGQGQVRILTLQAAGRKPVSARDFVNAHPDWRRTA